MNRIKWILIWISVITLARLSYKYNIFRNLKYAAMPETSSEAYLNSGDAYYNKGLYDKAIENYTKAIQINPEYASVYLHRGVAFDSKGLSD